MSRVEPYRRRLHAAEGHALRDRLAAWTAGLEIEEGYPEMPPGVEDRAADVWEALLTVADAAGGRWPQLSRVAAVTLVTSASESTPSLGVKLLADLRVAFGDHDSLHTETIVSTLLAMEESPWGDLRGKPLDSRRLANYLRSYSIQSRLIRIGAAVARGYVRADLRDAWARYLRPPVASDMSVTSVTGVKRNAVADTDVADVMPLRRSTSDEVIV
jgi:hypothetical protein